MVTNMAQSDRLGNPGTDPEFGHLPDGTMLAQLRLATGRYAPAFFRHATPFALHYPVAHPVCEVSALVPTPTP